MGGFHATMVAHHLEEPCGPIPEPSRLVVDVLHRRVESALSARLGVHHTPYTFSTSSP